MEELIKTESGNNTIEVDDNEREIEADNAVLGERDRER